MKDIKKEFKEDWYGQGLNAVPLIFNCAALSVYTIREDLGFNYTKFLCIYRKKYCDAHYWKPDLDRLSEIIFEKLLNKKYISDVQNIYKRDIDASKKIYRKIDKTDLQKIKKDELLALCQKTTNCIVDAVGVAHIIEPFTLLVDTSIKKMIDEEIGKENSKKYFSLLISPSEKPFISAYDELLLKLKKAKEKDKNKIVKQILKNYYWIKNNYSGRVELTPEIILEEANTHDNLEQINYKEKHKKKQEIIKELKLSKNLKFLLNITEKFADWQDVRKINVLIAIDYFCKITDELGKQYNLPGNLIYYALPQELTDEKLSSSKFVNELKKRLTYFAVVQYTDEYAYSTIERGTNKDHGDIKVINGMPTSPGIAVGKVKICRNVTQINKFQEGDVLVASMTRPEYLPAMKKAAAIITDEGGITCHAAIVARELGIPCIIGTKIATKVLKDNMLVQVKANHGIVEILK